jgi:hypothetical protein
MKKERASAFYARLKETYDKVSPEITEWLTSSNIPDIAFDSLIKWIAEEIQPSFRVGITDIKKAWDATRTQDGPKTFATVRRDCQVCGRVFMYNYSAHPDKNYIGVFQFCPHCGFPPRVVLIDRGEAITYRGDDEAMKIFKSVHEKLYLEMKGRKDFYKQAVDRDSEFAAMKLKGIFIPDNFAEARQ